MSNSSASEECHVPNLGVPIGNGWEGIRQDADGASAAVRSERLRSVICERIVPHLALIHQSWRSDAAAEPPTIDDIEAFSQAILGTDSTAADLLFERLRERGLTVDTLFETLLAPTARRLGELWYEDICDFVDVAVGVNRLRIMLEMYSNAPVVTSDARRRALLIATPDEKHVFGLDVISSFLRTSGWDVSPMVGRRSEEIARTAAENWFAVAGVTVAEESRLDSAARVIESVRRVSLNPSIAVIVGGWAFSGRPDLAARIGGDAIAEDGPSAALLAQKLYIAQAAAFPAKFSSHGDITAPSRRRSA